MLKDRLTIDGPICKISQRCGGPFKAMNWVLTTVVSILKKNSSAYTYFLLHHLFLRCAKWQEHLYTWKWIWNSLALCCSNWLIWRNYDDFLCLLRERAEMDNFSDVIKVYVEGTMMYNKISLWKKKCLKRRQKLDLTKYCPLLLFKFLSWLVLGST